MKSKRGTGFFPARQVSVGTLTPCGVSRDLYYHGLLLSASSTSYMRQVNKIELSNTKIKRITICCTYCRNRKTLHRQRLADDHFFILKKWWPDRYIIANAKRHLQKKYQTWLQRL